MYGDDLSGLDSQFGLTKFSTTIVAVWRNLVWTSTTETDSEQQKHHPMKRENLYFLSILKVATLSTFLKWYKWYILYFRTYTVSFAYFFTELCHKVWYYSGYNLVQNTVKSLTIQLTSLYFIVFSLDLNIKFTVALILLISLDIYFLHYLLQVSGKKYF